MASYLRPRDLDEALRALAQGRRRILAGGTDIYPAHVGRPLTEDVLDISALDGLGAIADRGEHWRIPALATWSDLIAAPLPPCFEGLKQAAREVGGVQIQNAGTICGNVCNASPAADGAPSLLALDAAVELSSAAGVRVLPLAEFLIGNRRTALRPDEMMTALIAPKPGLPARSAFRKLGARRYLVISIVMVAAAVETAPDGAIAEARVAVGACSPVARRLPELEKALIGRRLVPGLGEAVAAAHLAPLAPIDDIRAPAAYRLDAALTLVRRTLDDLVR